MSQLVDFISDGVTTITFTGNTSQFVNGNGQLSTPSGGGGSADIKQAQVTASYGSYEHEESIVDAGVTLSSQIQVGFDKTSSEDENEPGEVEVYAVPQDGFVVLSIRSEQPFGGVFKLAYIVGMIAFYILLTHGYL